MDASREVSLRVRTAASRLVTKLAAAERGLGESSEERSFAIVATALNEFLADCRATGLWGQANALPSSEAWKIAGSLLGRGWMMHRARTKPRGYAGDYELLARMFDKRLCDDPLGRLLDHYFQRDAAPVAVRNRMALMRDWIVEAANGTSLASVKIAVVGSAFGREVCEALLQLDDHQRARVHVVLLDIDPAALEYAAAQLSPCLLPEQLQTIAVNLFRLPQRPQLASQLADVDLLLCPGIFDYLDDAAASQMLRYLWQRLAPGGRMTVFQFAPHNPSRALMEWIGNWYLIYRDEGQLRAVTAAAGIPPEATAFGSEPQGVDLLVTAVRTGT
jgi:hypothetical protein